MNIWQAPNATAGITFEWGTTYQFIINNDVVMDISADGITIRGDSISTSGITIRGHNLILNNVVGIGVEEGTGAVIALTGHGTIRANGDFRIHLDDNQGIVPSDAKLRVFNGGDNEVFSVNELGDASMCLGGIVARTRQQGDFSEHELRVGGPNPGQGRGRVAIRNLPRIEGFESYSPGILVLYDSLGRDYFLWVDTEGVLRISKTDPTSDDYSGSDVVGEQVALYPDDGEGEPAHP